MQFVLKRSLVAGLVVLAGAAHSSDSLPLVKGQGAPAMARGWIVKLKESQPQSVVRLAAAAVPSDGATSQRNRLWQAAQRQRVGMLTHKPTAFGANVVRAGRLMSMAEAEVEAARLRQDPDVEWVEVNVIERSMALTPVSATTVATPPNDLFYAQQVWLGDRTTALAGVANFPDAWAAMAGQQVYPVTVAVLDTGTLAHTELSGRLYPGYDFVSEVEYSRDGDGIDPYPTDPGDYLTSTQKANNPLLYPDECEVTTSSWHGFSILNMLAARTNNSTFGAGILAPLPEGMPWVLPVRVGTVCGADRSDIVEGMLWSAGVSYQGSPGLTNNPLPARVISLSYGSEGDCGATIYSQVVATLKQRGTVLVASAGNGNSSNVGEVTPTVPASCPGVLAVTALNQRGTKASYANFVETSGSLWGLAVSAGDTSDITDSAVFTLSNDGAYQASSSFSMKRLYGTSFAAPQAAGVVALMLALNPALTVDEVLAKITASARSWDDVNADLTTSGQFFDVAGACTVGATGACRCTTSTCGSGVLDAGKAVRDLFPLPGTITPFEPPAVSASYFVPDRTQTSSSGSGGGGGAMGWAWGVALYMVLAGTWLASRSSATATLRTGRR